MIADGALHKHIARDLGISINTVATHVRRASLKIGGPGLPTRKITRYHHLFQASDSGEAA